MGQSQVIRRNTIPPVNVVSLMTAVGPTQAAARLGVSTTLLHKSKKENAINQVVEIAAGYVLEHLTDPPAAKARATAASQRNADALFLLAVPADKVGAVQRMTAAMGGELVAA